MLVYSVHAGEGLQHFKRLSRLSLIFPICQAAVELSPAHNAMLALRLKKMAAQRLLQQHSGPNWCTSEILSYILDPAVTCMGGFLLFLFFQCLLHKWRRHKGAHPAASCHTPWGAGKVISRVHKIWNTLETGVFCFKLWYIVLYSLIYGKLFRAWTKCKMKLTQPVLHYFDHGRLVHMKVTISIYYCLPSLGVSAVVTFLWLLMSGDVELNPGPKEGKCR